MEMQEQKKNKRGLPVIPMPEPNQPKEESTDRPKPRKKRIVGIAKKLYQSKVISILAIFLLSLFLTRGVKADGSDLTIGSNILTKTSDSFTLLLYMCGSDLESSYGMATMDIYEMLNANIPKSCNILIYTGGTATWRNSYISPNAHQVFLVRDHELIPLTAFPIKSMGNPSCLREFLSFARSNYPANRYGLIFWDHGGGAIFGYGYETQAPPYDSLSLSEIRSSLLSSDITFDFIGFDACLMGSVEVAWSLKDISRYLIASEEVEPGIGWYYTDFLSSLLSPTEILAREIIDGYISKCSLLKDNINYTLSLINLEKINNIKLNLNKINNKNIYEIKNNTKKFLANENAAEYDLIDFLTRARIETEEVKKAIFERHLFEDPSINGLSICIPDEVTSLLASKVFKEVEIDKEYISWLEGLYKEVKEEFTFDLTWHKRNGEYILRLSDSDYTSILSIERCLIYKEGNIYLSLGSDNTFSYSNEGYLVADTDSTWLTIDGWPVTYHYLTDATGYVDCKICKKGTDQYIDCKLLLNVSRETPVIEGAIPISKNGQLIGKSTIGVYPGDKVYLLYSNYTNDKVILSADEITIAEDTVIGDSYLEDNMYIYYRITDKNGTAHETKIIRLQ